MEIARKLVIALMLALFALGSVACSAEVRGDGEGVEGEIDGEGEGEGGEGEGD
jgi:hypothetical protein